MSSSEPAQLRAIGTQTNYPERFGADILFLVATPAGSIRVGIQRKEATSDLFNSIEQGRLQEQVLKLQAVEEKWLIIEGSIPWSSSGECLLPRVTFSRKRWFGLLFSLQVRYGMKILETRSLAETIEQVQHLQEWHRKGGGDAMMTRPKVAAEWDDPLSHDRKIHFLQGMPMIGPKTAAQILQHFGRLPVRWDCTREQLLEVYGLGEKTVNVLTRFLPAGAA